MATTTFPEKQLVETPLGIAANIWATNENHIGLIGDFIVNRVPYHVRLDLHFRDGEWKEGNEDTNMSAWNALMISRSEWNYSKGRRPEVSDSARRKIRETIVPWLRNFANSTDGKAMTRAAGARAKQTAINSKRAAIETHRAEIEQLEAELKRLESV